MKIVFMGTPQAAVPTLERLIEDGHDVVAVYTQPDRPSGRGNKIVFSPVKEFAIRRAIPVYQPTKVKTVEAAEDFRSLDADIAVVVAYGRILPEAFLTAFPNGAVNVHFSMLPAYRGAAPVNWAIVNGETKTGATTMRMDIGLDTGDILLQRETEIGGHETSVELMDRLAVMGAELCSETLRNLKHIDARAQDHSVATFAPIMKKSDGQIDWTMSALDITNRIRGFQPFPSAFTFLNEKRFTIWRTEAADGGFGAGPGTILAGGAGELLVSCGSGTVISLLEIQFEGKRRVHAKEFLNSGQLRPGMVFG